MDAAATEMAHAAMPFAALLGVEVHEASPECVVARLAWDESRCTSGGVMHGGALMALADSCGGTLAFLGLPDGATGTTTIESKTNFFRAVTGGHVTATARVLHQGRSTIVVDTEIADAEARLVARVTQTQAVLGAG